MRFYDKNSIFDNSQRRELNVTEQWVNKNKYKSKITTESDWNFCGC